MFVNNVAGSLMASVGLVNIPSGSFSIIEGQKLFEVLKASTTPAGMGTTGAVMMSFSVTPGTFINGAGGSMSRFSSYGLDNELHIKPVRYLVEVVFEWMCLLRRLTCFSR
jgi:hypothetical protein